MRRVLLALSLLAACSGSAASPPDVDGPQGLGVRLTADAERINRAIDPAAAAREIVSHWKLSQAEWKQRLVPAYAGMWKDYSRAFDEAAPALAERLAVWSAEATELNVRFHFAGDPELSRAQSRLRTALETGAPGVAVVPAEGEVMLGEVFVFDGAHWRTLTGLDEAITARVRAHSETCAQDLLRSGRLDRCGDLGWEITRAAIADDATALARACALAHPHCVSN